MLMNYTRRKKGKINLIIDNPHNNTKPDAGSVIHTFGDSHANFGWGDDIKKNNIISLLCYTFGKKKLQRLDIRRFNVKVNDTIIFCLGEIDCRCHIHKHITPDNTYQMIIDGIIGDYIDAIQINIKLSNLKLKNVCIYNVVPPIQKYNTIENPEYPYLGSDEERKQYALYFNECIKQKCNENNWIFFDIYNCYADEYGFLRKDLSDGSVHIKNGVYIQKFIDEYLL